MCLALQQGRIFGGKKRPNCFSFLKYLRRAHRRRESQIPDHLMTVVIFVSMATVCWLTSIGLTALIHPLSAEKDVLGLLFF